MNLEDVKQERNTTESSGLSVKKKTNCVARTWKKMSVSCF